MNIKRSMPTAKPALLSSQKETKSGSQRSTCSYATSRRASSDSATSAPTRSQPRSPARRIVCACHQRSTPPSLCRRPRPSTPTCPGRLKVGRSVPAACCATPHPALPVPAAGSRRDVFTPRSCITRRTHLDWTPGHARQRGLGGGPLARHLAWCATRKGGGGLRPALRYRRGGKPGRRPVAAVRASGTHLGAASKRKGRGCHACVRVWS
mmetsp:Transcript_3495/g.8842  ORF Transcript_3495/g.8842 Transcript_3495/m.8842 type:complete len:209 (+) Transcript_3495:254-880(+)